MGVRPHLTIGVPLRWAYLAVVAASPLLFGGNVPLAWGLNAALTGAVAIGFAFAYWRARQPFPVPASWLGVPLAAFMLVVTWILIQTSSFVPESWHHPAWERASRALGETLPGSISIDPWATRLGLLRLVTTGVAFWLALQIGRDPVWARRIIFCVALFAALYAIYGMAETSVGSRSILWLPKSDFEDIPTATFINPNHFAAYASLGLAAALGMLVHTLRSAFAGHSGPWTNRWALAVTHHGGALTAQATILFALITATVLTGSRSGFFLMLAGSATMIAIEGVRARNKYSALLMTVAALAIGGLCLSAVSSNRVATEFSQTRASDLSSRLAVAQMTIRAIADAPITGFGYGSFSEVFPSYRDGRIPLEGIWLEAHNSYLEAILGLGIPAALLLLLAIGWPAARCFAGALRRRRDHTAPLVATAGSIMLGLHALIDFSIQLQGITITYAALLGCGTAQSWSSQRTAEPA